MINTLAVVFPFDLFGSSGTSAGAKLLGDALRELIADNRRETRPSRCNAYRPHFRLKECVFETMAEWQDWRSRGRQLARQAWRADQCLFWLAGNHLGVLPIYDVLAERGDTAIVQLDAHLDIYDFDDCISTLSHGNFLKHLEQPRPPLIQLGHRDLFLLPDAVDSVFQWTFSAAELHTEPAACLDRLRQALHGQRRIFVDIDVDVFDPAFFPAMQQPLPFGLAPAFLLQVLSVIGFDRLIGLGVSEFDPARDVRDRSLETLMWLLEWTLLRKYERPTTS